MAGLHGIGHQCALDRSFGCNGDIFQECRNYPDRLYPIAITFLILTFWFPNMRYELDQDQLNLRYGPVIKHRIPLKAIRSIRRRNLSMTIWSTVRFPGIALFTVPYADVGKVRMCATAALNNVLLIETEKEKYGLTPADEDAFVAAIQAQLED